MATVMGRTPASRSAPTFHDAAPPQNDIGSCPCSSPAIEAASEIVSGYSALPDMYISLPGRTPRWFADARVLESFAPKCRPSCLPSARRRVSIGIASAGWRSFAKPSGISATSPSPSPWRISRAFSWPRSVGLSLTRVSSLFSTSMYAQIDSISPGGHPCIVERVTDWQIRAGIRSGSDRSREVRSSHGVPARRLGLPVLGEPRFRRRIDEPVHEPVRVRRMPRRGPG